MLSEKSVRLSRKVREDRAREHAERKDWDGWMSACNAVRALDHVLEEDQRPGYHDPLERIPFSADFARKFAALDDEMAARVPIHEPAPAETKGKS